MVKTMQLSISCNPRVLNIDKPSSTVGRFWGLGVKSSTVELGLVLDSRHGGLALDSDFQDSAVRAVWIRTLMIHRPISVFRPSMHQLQCSVLQSVLNELNNGWA